MSQCERSGDPVRAAWPMFALFLLLGVAVFCWGLGDKLSLYATVHGAHPTAKAKLLTEQATARAIASAQADPYATPHAEMQHQTSFCWAFAILLGLSFANHLRKEPHETAVGFCRGLSFLLVSIRRRPPPVASRAFPGGAPLLAAVLA